MELKNNSGNTVALYLSSQVTISDPVYFLFKLSNGETTGNIYFTATDISTNPYEYNEFIWTLTGTGQNLTAGTITIDSGYYDLDVYQSSALTYSISGAVGGPIYQSVVHISATTTSNIYTYSGDSSTIYTYSPS